MAIQLPEMNSDLLYRNLRLLENEGRCINFIHLCSSGSNGKTCLMEALKIRYGRRLLKIPSASYDSEMYRITFGNHYIDILVDNGESNDAILFTRTYGGRDGIEPDIVIMRLVELLNGMLGNI